MNIPLWTVGFGVVYLDRNSYFVHFYVQEHSFLCIMTYFTSWEDFAKAAEILYVNDPMKVYCRPSRAA